MGGDDREEDLRRVGRRVVIAVRRGPEHVKFSLAELKELIRERPGGVRIDARTHAAWADLRVDRATEGDAVLQALPTSHSTPESFIGALGLRPLVTAWLMTAWRFSLSNSISRCCFSIKASIFAVSWSRKLATCSASSSVGHANAKLSIVLIPKFFWVFALLYIMQKHL